jgi:four helix bundle protein
MTGEGSSAGRARAARFQDLVVWRKAHQLALCVYGVTSDFPPSERYGLTQQFRKAAVSIPANIAEGFKRRGRGDKARFLNIAQGSLEECRYYIILARDLGYLPDSEPSELVLEEVSKLLVAYGRAILNSRNF